MKLQKRKSTVWIKIHMKNLLYRIIFPIVVFVIQFSLATQINLTNMEMSKYNEGQSGSSLLIFYFLQVLLSSLSIIMSLYFFLKLILVRKYRKGINVIVLLLWILNLYYNSLVLYIFFGINL